MKYGWGFKPKTPIFQSMEHFENMFKIEQKSLVKHNGYRLLSIERDLAKIYMLANNSFTSDNGFKVMSIL